jgi:hypothetical protein
VPEGWSSYEPDLHKEYGYTFLHNQNALLHVSNF